MPPPHGTWRSADGKYVVCVSARAYKDMLRLARKHAPVEAGTALVGTYSDDGHIATVAGLAPMTPDSRGSRFSFHRGVSGLGGFLRRLFRLSGGRTHYVGEWHSHVGGPPVPSPTDEQNMMEIAGDPRARCPECICVILGLNDDKGELAIYVFSAAPGRIDLVRLDPSAP